LNSSLLNQLDTPAFPGPGGRRELVYGRGTNSLQGAQSNTPQRENFAPLKQKKGALEMGGGGSTEKNV